MYNVNTLYFDSVQLPLLSCSLLQEGGDDFEVIHVIIIQTT